MKHLLLLFVAVYSSVSLTRSIERQVPLADPGLELIDTIDVIISYADQPPVVICRSEGRRLTIEGAPQRLEDVIFKQSVGLDADSKGLKIDEQEIYSYIERLKRTHNLSSQQLEGIFAASGYTYEQGVEELKLQYKMEGMFQGLRSRALVSAREIDEYYAQNTPVKYRICTTFVERDMTLRRSEQERQLKNKRDKKQLDLVWGEAFVVRRSDLARDKLFLTTMNVGDISDPVFVDKNGRQGFEFYKMIEIKTKPLTQQLRAQISDKLSRPKYEKLFEEYRNNLIAHSTVVKFVY